MKYTNTTSSNQLQIRTYNRILHIIARQNGPDAATERAQLYGLEACLEDPNEFFVRAKSVCTEQNWDEFHIMNSVLHAVLTAIQNLHADKIPVPESQHEEEFLRNLSQLHELYESLSDLTSVLYLLFFWKEPEFLDLSDDELIKAVLTINRKVEQISNNFTALRDRVQPTPVAVENLLAIQTEPEGIPLYYLVCHALLNFNIDAISAMAKKSLEVFDELKTARNFKAPEGATIIKLSNPKTKH